MMLRYATRSPRSKPVYYSAKTRDTQLIASINERSPSGRSSGFDAERFPTHSLRYAWTIAMRRFVLLSLLFTCQHSGSCFERDKRYLVFPTPGPSAPTKVQVYNSGNSWYLCLFLFSNKQYLLKLFFPFFGKFEFPRVERVASVISTITDKRRMFSSKDEGVKFIPDRLYRRVITPIVASIDNPPLSTIRLIVRVILIGYRSLIV